MPMATIVKQIFDSIEKEFFVKLQKKTSWGRNEIIDAWKTAKADAAISLLGSGLKEEL